MMLYVRALQNIKADNAYVGNVQIIDMMNLVPVMENVYGKMCVYTYICLNLSRRNSISHRNPASVSDIVGMKSLVGDFNLYIYTYLNT